MEKQGALYVWGYGPPRSVLLLKGEGQSWAAELRRVFSLALENYIWRYGLELE